jgi:flagellar hook-length control protein FliK
MPAPQAHGGPGTTADGATAGTTTGAPTSAAPNPQAVPLPIAAQPSAQPATQPATAAAGTNVATAPVAGAPDGNPAGSGGGMGTGSGAGTPTGLLDTTTDASALPGAAGGLPGAAADEALATLADELSTTGAIGLATQVAVAADAAIASTSAAALTTPVAGTTLPTLGAPAELAPSLSHASHAALPSHVAELSRLARVAADGSARLTVRLDPPELGAVTLHLTSRGSDVQLALRAETAGGAAALAGQQNRLRELLAAHGFDLARFTISGSDSASLSDPGRQRDGSADGRPGEQRAADARSGDFTSGRQQGERSRAMFGGEGSDFGGSRSGSGSSQYGEASGLDRSPRFPARPAAQEGTWL